MHCGEESITVFFTLRFSDPRTTTQNKMASLFVNEEQTNEFISALREITSSFDYFYVTIMSRAKYGGVDNLFFRKLVQLDRVVEEIHQATPLRGFYFKGKLVPHDSLAVYITPEPRDLERAGKEICAAFVLKSEGTTVFNLSSMFLSECQKHASQKRVLDIDIDDKSKYLAVRKVLDANEIQPKFTLESRGGYHLLCYDLSRKNQKLVHDTSQEVGDIDLLRNSMVPLPGTLQGGVEVKWIK